MDNLRQQDARGLHGLIRTAARRLEDGEDYNKVVSDLRAIADELDRRRQGGGFKIERG